MSYLVLALTLQLGSAALALDPCDLEPTCPQEACPVLDLAALLARLEALPDLEAARALETQARVVAGKAGRLPNPELEAEFEDLGLSQPAWARSQVTLGLSQQIPLGSRREAERRARQLEADLAGARTAFLRRELELEARRLFLEALEGRRRLALLGEARQQGQEELARLARRQRLGGSPDHETLTWEVEVSALGGRLEAECLDQRLRLGALATLAGLEDWRNLRLAWPEPGETGSLDLPLAEPLNQQAAGLRQARLARQQAEAELALQEALATPDLALGGGLRGLDGFEQQTLVFSLALPLPLFDRNQGPRAQAAGRVQAARAEEVKVLRLRQTRLSVLEARLELARRRSQTLDQQELPGLQRLMAALALRQLQQGGELAGLMEARARLLEARLERLSLDSLLAMTRLELKAARDEGREVER